MIRWDVPGYEVVFSTRQGGVSEGPFQSLNLGRMTGDEPERVDENRRRLCAEVGADPEKIALNRQQHTAIANRAVPGSRGVPGDGLWSDTPGEPMLALAADCLSIAIARANGSEPALAVLHAGWKGLLEGVVDECVRVLGGSRLQAMIGPAIGPCCYAPPASERGSCALASSTYGVRGSARCAQPASSRSNAPICARGAIPNSSSPSGARASRAARTVSSVSLRADDVAERLERIRAEVGSEVTIVAATKYVSVDDMTALAEARVEVVGENRAQDLQAKHAAHGDAFRWHFIGHLQSRKAKIVNGICELVHSLDSESSAKRLEIPALVEVNLSDEESKSGIAPDDLPRFLDLYEDVRGLMTMPPLAEDPEASRPYFRRLRELAEEHGLGELSMGTSQDYRVAVEEGATLIRLGRVLYGGDGR